MEESGRPWQSFDSKNTHSVRMRLWKSNQTVHQENRWRPWMTADKVADTFPSLGDPHGEWLKSQLERKPSWLNKKLSLSFSIFDSLDFDGRRPWNDEFKQIQVTLDEHTHTQTRIKSESSVVRLSALREAYGSWSKRFNENADQNSPFLIELLFWNVFLSRAPALGPPRSSINHLVVFRQGLVDQVSSFLFFLKCVCVCVCVCARSTGLGVFEIIIFFPQQPTETATQHCAVERPRFCVLMQKSVNISWNGRLSWRRTGF